MLWINTIKPSKLVAVIIILYFRALWDQPESLFELADSQKWSLLPFIFILLGELLL